MAEAGGEEVGEESRLRQLLWLLINSSGVSRWWCPLVLETLFRLWMLGCLAVPVLSHLV